MSEDINIIGMLRAHRVVLATLLAAKVGTHQDDSFFEELRAGLLHQALWMDSPNAEREPPGINDAVFGEMDAIISEMQSQHRRRFGS